MPARDSRVGWRAELPDISISPHRPGQRAGGVPAQRETLVGQREDEGDDEQDHGDRGAVPELDALWTPLKKRYVSIVFDAFAGSAQGHDPDHVEQLE